MFSNILNLFPMSSSTTKSYLHHFVMPPSDKLKCYMLSEKSDSLIAYCSVSCNNPKYAEYLYHFLNLLIVYMKDLLFRVQLLIVLLSVLFLK